MYRTDPEYAWAYFAKSAALAILNNTAEALENLQTAIELDEEFKDLAKENDAFKNLKNNKEFINLTK